MSPHDMIKKKTKEVEAQAGPVEIQRKREQAMFVQSITRQYEEAWKQETKLARQLRQGPPDSVIKKSRWSSKKKRALDELSKRNKEQFGAFAREGEEAVSRMSYALRQSRNEAQEQGREWNEKEIVHVFQESVMGDKALTDLVEKDTEISSEFQKLAAFYERLYQEELPAGELAAEFLAFAKTASVDFGPGIRHLTESEDQEICLGTVPVTEQPEALRMVLFQSVTTALFQCMDQVGLEAVNLDAFAKMRAAAQASSVACGELFLDRKYRIQGKQAHEARPVLHEKVRLENERVEKEKSLQQEQERLKKETKPQQDAEYERINHRQIEKFLEDGGDIHTLSWAKEQYPGWIREALRERITDNPAEFSTEMMRAKERLDAHLAEIQAFVEQHPELTCGIPMFEAVQCRHLAELAGVGAICGEQRLDGTRLQESQEQLRHDTEEEIRTYRRRQEILKENLPGLDPKEWEAFWKAPELEKLILHTENESEFKHHASMIGIHAKMNEKIIHQLTKEEGLTVGADYAAEEIRKLLGPRFLLGPFAGVEMDARFYISNLNTYVPMAFAMEQKFQSSMKKNGISNATVGPLAEALKLTQVDFLDKNALEYNVKKWKTVAEQNASWLAEKLEKEQLTTDQWETIRILEKQSLLMEQKLFQDAVQKVMEWDQGDAPLLSRKDYLYGEKGKELNARTEIYKKQLEGADLCEAEELHGLLAGKKEKEMAGEALESILRRGRLQETFPYLKEIKNLRELDQLTHEQYYELTDFLRKHTALAIQPWSELHGPGMSEIKEKLLEQILLGHVTAENIGQEAERQQEKWKKNVKAEALRLYTVLGSETQEEKPLVLRYLKVGAKTGVEVPEKRIKKFQMSGMDPVLMAPGTEGEALLYEQDEAKYKEGLSWMEEEVSWRLHFAEETAKIVYHDEAQKEQRSQLFDRLKRVVVQMEPFPGSTAVPDEAMRRRNQERFGAASPEELLTRTLNLAEASPDGNILEQSEVKEAAEVYQKRVELLKQQGSRSLSLLIPFMLEDKSMWKHMMTDEDDAFTVYLAKWKEKHPALTQLEALPESYGWQFMAEKSEEIMAGTGDEQYWKQEIREFMSLFENRRVDGTSINERRESAGNWQYIALIEEDLYSGALGLEILYDNKRLGQVFKSYDKQKKANGKALAAYLKTQKVPKEKAKQFALQMKYLQAREKPEDFAEKLNSRYETFLRNGQDEKSEQERLKKLKEDREKAREEIVSMRAEGEKAIEKDRKILERLRAQYWKSGSVILAASGVWGDLDQKVILKTGEALEKTWGDDTSEAVLELLKEVKLANPKMKEAELGNIRQWLLDAEQMIREKGATKELGRDEQNRLLTYLYLHYYKAADFAVSEISVRKVHNEWTERRNVLLDLTGRLKTITVPSLAMEMRDLLRYLQMGIFTLDQQEFDELAESRTTYFENAQILHEIIAEEVEAERERIQEDGKQKLFSDTFAAEIRADFMECFQKYAAGKPLEEADREKVRTEVRDCLQTEEKFRYVLDSRSSMGRVSWDDLKLEEKSGVSVNRKDLEQLIESTGSKKQVEWYSGLTVPQRKLFALGLMMCDQDRSMAEKFVFKIDYTERNDYQKQLAIFDKIQPKTHDRILLFCERKYNIVTEI